MSSVMRFDEWQDSDGNPVFNGAGGVSPGGLIAVKSAIRDTIFDASVSGGGNVAVPGLSITHEVANASNKLVISVFLGALGNSGGFAQGGIAVHDGTGLIAVGDTAGSRTSLTAGGQGSPSSSATVTLSPAATFVHTPGSGSKTFTVRAVNVSTTTATVFINRHASDEDASNRVRAVSSIVIQEVTV